MIVLADPVKGAMLEANDIDVELAMLPDRIEPPHPPFHKHKEKNHKKHVTPHIKTSADKKNHKKHVIPHIKTTTSNILF